MIFFGATASGKTSLASEIFSYKNSKDFSKEGGVSAISACAEVISADSVQVYKHLHIGSASPSKEELEDLPHHLIAVKEPSEEFSAADFVREADKLCPEIYARGKLPVLMGGTAFFLKNFIYGLPVTPTADPKIREHFQKRAKEEGAAVLLDELKTIDPVSAQRLHVHDEYRIIRAHEVFAASGRPLSSFALPETPREEYEFFILSIERTRSLLYERIEKRVDAMFAEGLYDEVKKLYEMGYTGESPALKAIGYREFFDENNRLKPESALEEVSALIKRNTKHYAKRQETFFKTIPDVHRYFIEGETEILRLYKDICGFYGKRVKTMELD
nr:MULTISPECIES: tRNA (adenosine(37)-N6)-dimethylallyltransferase MiaA [unclassified Treponema]